MTLEEACNSFYEKILNHCYRRTSNNKYDAEEITSEVFLLLSQKWDTIESHEENRILCWLFSAANNVIAAQQRAKRTQENIIVSMTAEDGADIELPDESVDGYEENRKYENYISQIKEALCDKDFELFEYIVIQDLPYKDVGQKFRISESAAKMRWQRIKRKLESILAGILPDEL